MNRAVETAFLPAALELEQSPASPAGRATMAAISLLFVLAVGWATIGHVDIVAVAPGRVIASGQSKTIQPLEIGQVVAIEVQEGMSVKAGDVLIRLDPEIARAELARVSEALEDAEEDVKRFRLLAEWAAQAESHHTSAVDDASVAPLLRETWAEHVARLAVFDKEQGRLSAAKESAEQGVAKLAAILPIIEQRASDQRRLVKKELLSEADYLDTEQRRLETRHDLNAQRARVRELAAAIIEVDARAAEAHRAFARSVSDQHEQARRQIDELTQERLKARSRLEARTIRSPVDGTVQQLAVNHLGAVVTPAQSLMVVVPSDGMLEVDATLENKDVGFVGVGQKAMVKIDAFPFTRYGMIDGQVVGLSDDAVADEQRGMVFKMRVRLERADIQVNEKLVPLSPGMTVIVESKTGERRLIEYVLSPLLRYRDESVRER